MEDSVRHHSDRLAALDAVICGVLKELEMEMSRRCLEVGTLAEARMAEAEGRVAKQWSEWREAFWGSLEERTAEWSEGADVRAPSLSAVFERLAKEVEERVGQRREDPIPGACAMREELE